MQKTQSGGGVVLGPHAKVLVVNQNGTSWSLPKGRLEPGENVKQATIREIKEESGISQLEFVKELGSYQRFQIGLDGGENKDEFKTIHMFLCTTDQTELQPEDPDNPEARWVEPENVSSLLTHPKDKQFFESVLSEIYAFLKSSQA